jgi:hypothetical protein
MGTPVAPFILENQHTNWRCSHFTSKLENSLMLIRSYSLKSPCLKNLNIPKNRTPRIEPCQKLRSKLLVSSELTRAPTIVKIEKTNMSGFVNLSRFIFINQFYLHHLQTFSQTKQQRML